MDEGKHYILLPVLKIGIFRDQVAPPDFPENTDMAKDLDYKTGLDFWGLFFGEKSPSYRRINTVYRRYCHNHYHQRKQLRQKKKIIIIITIKLQ